MGLKIYHAHIPKTAGTSLNSWLNDAASFDRVKSDTFDGELFQWLKQHGFKGPAAEHATSAACWQLFDVLHGHRSFMVPRPEKAVVITVLREPVSRSISLFHDVASLDITDLRHLVGENFQYRSDCLQLSFAEIRKKWGDSIPFRSQHEDFMCRFFLRPHLKHDHFFALSPQERFTQTVALIDRELAAVGVTEQMSRSMLLFSRAMHRYPIESLPRYNQSKTHKSEITQEDKAFLHSITAADRMLWEHYTRKLEDSDISYSVEDFENCHLKAALSTVVQHKIGSDLVYDMNASLVGGGFWDRDAPGEDACRRWSGPGDEAVLYLPARSEVERIVRVYIANWNSAEARSSFNVSVWGEPADWRFGRKQQGAEDVVTFRARPRGRALKLQFKCKATPALHQNRVTGFCIESVSIGERNELFNV